MSKNSYLQIKSLHKTYNVNTPNAVDAIKDISFSLPKKGLVFIIGKSGCGKSTLLNILSGIDNPTSGEVSINGEKMDFSSKNYLDNYRNHKVGLIFQDHNLLDDFTVQENINMSLKFQNKSISSKDIEEILKKVDLCEVGDKKANQLSGGQRQRVSIARALIKQPKLLLADEPTGNLDSVNSKKIFELLKKIARDTLVVVVTHDLDNAYYYGDRIIELKDGKIVNDIIKKSQFDIETLKLSYKKEIDKAFEKNDAVNSQSAPINEPQKIKSHSSLSISNACKISFTWLCKNKISTIISILIVAFMIGLLGITFNARDYDYCKALSNTIIDNNVNATMIFKGHYDINTRSMVLPDDNIFKDDEIAVYKDKFGAVYKIYNVSYSFNKFVNETDKMFSPVINSIMEFESQINEKNLSKFYHAKLLYGNYPSYNDDCIELLISDYIADSILFFGATFDNGIVMPNVDCSNLIGKIFSTHSINFKIVGIYSTMYSNLYKNDYEIAKENDNFNYAYNFIYPSAIVNQNVLKNFAYDAQFMASSLTIKNFLANYYTTYDTIIFGTNNLSDVYKQCLIQGSQIKLASNITDISIGNNQILIPYSLYLELFNAYEFDEMGNMVSTFESLEPSDLVDLQLQEYIDEKTIKTYSIAGVFCGNSNMDSIVIVNRASKNEYVDRALMTVVLCVGLNNRATTYELIKYGQDNNAVIYDSSTIKIYAFQEAFTLFKDTIHALIIALIFIIILILYSLISKNVRERQKDIGILRALGANRKDIIKIFLLSDGIYIICASILSVVCYLFGATIVNKIFSANIGASLTLFSASATSILLMIAFSIILIIISSILPILKYSRLAPIVVMKDTQN